MAHPVSPRGLARRSFGALGCQHGKWGLRLLNLACAASLLLFCSRARGQAVQLPTQRVFSVGTTVMAPDRGSISLGGVSRAREGSAGRGWGPFRNRGRGRELARDGATLSVRILDLKAMDEAVLAAAARQRRLPPQGGSPELQRAAYLTRHMGRSSRAPVMLRAAGGDRSNELARAGRPVR